MNSESIAKIINKWWYYCALTECIKGLHRVPYVFIKSAISYILGWIYCSLSLSALVKTIIKGLWVSVNMSIRSLSESISPTFISTRIISLCKLKKSTSITLQHRFFQIYFHKFPPIFFIFFDCFSKTITWTVNQCCL